LACEPEIDEHWIAEVPELPGVLCDSDSTADAISKAEVLALEVTGDRLEKWQLGVRDYQPNSPHQRMRH
jgi:predicted RNase H-like HicB family nuclease